MELVEGDIKYLNEDICVLQDSLLQCGKQCPGLLESLFTAYCTVQEIDFKGYKNLQSTHYIDGKADFEVQELIEVASNHCKMLVEIGTWKTTKATEVCFVTLAAEIVVLNEINATYKGKIDGD